MIFHNLLSHRMHIVKIVRLKLHFKAIFFTCIVQIKCNFSNKAF